MQIIERSGDFLAGDEVLIIHGCNAQGVMGSGAALAVRERISVAYRVYREVYLLRGLTVGEVIFAIDVGGDAKRPRIVGNAITQEHFGASGRYVNYAGLREALRRVDRFVALTHDALQIAGVSPLTAVGMPMIGAGLGGGDWTEIAKIIEAESAHFTPVVYRLA